MYPFLKNIALETMAWILPGRLSELFDNLLHVCLRSMITLCFLLSLCHYMGWLERWIWWKIEDEASKVLNRAKVTVGSFRIDISELLQGKITLYTSNAILHTPQRREWGWDSPVIARIGKAKIECNAPVTILHLVLLKKELPIDLYTLVLEDVQVFVERHESVFNVYLLDSCCILPPPPFAGTEDTVDGDIIKESMSSDLSSHEDATEEIAGTSSERSSGHEEKAQKLVDDMLQSVESLGRAAGRGNFLLSVRQHGLKLSDKIREGLGRQNRNKKEQLEEGVNVLRTAGKVAVKSLQSTPKLVLPERLVRESKPLPLCRVGRIGVRDLRIFTKDSWIHLQEEENHDNISNSNMGGWNKPIFIKSMMIRAAEMCPPMSLKDEQGLPAAYQTLDKAIDIVWRRLLAEIAKSNTGKVFSVAMFEVLSLMKTGANFTLPDTSAM
jgi:hypothetical protein